MLIDTSAIVRFLTGDDPKKAIAVRNFLNSPGEAVWLTNTITAEVYFTLLSYYDFPKARIIEKLRKLIALPKIRCDQQLLSRAFELAENTSLSFADAYLAAVALSVRGDGRILSYDHDFDKIAGIKRIEL